MDWVGRMGGLVLALAAAQVVAAPASAPSMPLAALKQIEPGLWQIEVKGRSSRLICVTDAAALVQVEHEQPGCSRFVIANEAKSATVHYSCQGAGWGRTTVRVDTAATAVIHTQGISNNQPFDYTAQARRQGNCGTASASRQL